MNLDWMASAACADHPDPDIFFPSSTGPLARRQAAEAALVCKGCPVIAQCREHKKNTGASAGVWGGAYHRTHEPRKPPPIKHGTETGFWQHQQRGETSCGRCRFAHALSQRKYAERKRASA